MRRGNGEKLIKLSKAAYVVCIAMILLSKIRDVLLAGEVSIGGVIGAILGACVYIFLAYTVKEAIKGIGYLEIRADEGRVSGVSERIRRKALRKNLFYKKKGIAVIDAVKTHIDRDF